MNAKPVLKASVGATSLFTAMTIGVLLTASAVEARPTDPYASLPPTIRLTGIIRDFKERTASGGHPDFELNPTRGFAHFNQLVQDQLDDDGKPVFNTTGHLVTTEWKDAAGRNRLNPRTYIDARTGDRNGAVETQLGGALTSADRFAQWYRDTPGVSMSAPLSLTLTRTANTNMYTFNDQTDTLYHSRGGFFPINGELWGNSSGETKNFHFTFELSTTFMFNRGGGQVFTFTGDDDVWVFIDNKLVIDIGGIHGATSQTVELDRLNWLETGHRYSLKFFMAERHRTQSNFRMDTTITLESAPLPTTAPLYD